MKRSAWLFSGALLVASFFCATPNVAQSLKLSWKKDFPKSVSWYVRTSPGILLVRSGKSLTALDGEDGRQLWMLPEVQIGEEPLAGMPGTFQRGLNVLEVPAMGVLLLNGAKLPGNSDRRLIGLNLMTGQKLWDKDEVDELMTVIPLYERGQIVLVSRRPQKKILAAEMAASVATPLPGVFALANLFPYPYRFEFERLDLASGKILWNSEYPHTFTPGPTNVRAFGAYLFIDFRNHVLGCVDLANRKLLWEDHSRRFGSGSLSLPLQISNGWLIYGSTDVQALDPATETPGWRIEKLGKVTGIFVHDGLAVAVGEKLIVAVDAANGTERWRKKTHGHTTNLIWDKESDGLVYVDWKGLHHVARVSGKSLLDAPLDLDSQPYRIRMASPECLLTIGYRETNCFSLKTGKRIFREGKLSGLFRSEAFLDEWPMPEFGQALQRMVSVPSEGTEWESIRHGTLLSAESVKNLEERSSEQEGALETYQTESEDGVRKIWWVDPQTNRQMVIRPAAQQHDVSRRLGNVYAVDGKMLWAAKIDMN